MVPGENDVLTDERTVRQKDGQTTMILQGPLKNEGPIVKVTLNFPEFLSDHQKLV